ncbi:hypothetical protein UlMin_006095, partial [Ulmus minor]
PKKGKVKVIQKKAMDSAGKELLHDKNENKQSEAAESIHSGVLGTQVSKSVSSSPNIIQQAYTSNWKRGGDNINQDTPLPEKMDAFAEVYMEASIMVDDVIRAGGFGARDDISSFLPVASDSTDFEAEIREAREYEETQVETRRPGLGYMGTTETK